MGTFVRSFVVDGAVFELCLQLDGAGREPVDQRGNMLGEPSMPDQPKVEALVRGLLPEAF